MALSDALHRRQSVVDRPYEERLADLFWAVAADMTVLNRLPGGRDAAAPSTNPLGMRVRRDMRLSFRTFAARKQALRALGAWGNRDRERAVLRQAATLGPEQTMRASTQMLLLAREAGVKGALQVQVSVTDQVRHRLGNLRQRAGVVAHTAKL